MDTTMSWDMAAAALAEQVGLEAAAAVEGAAEYRTLHHAPVYETRIVQRLYSRWKFRWIYQWFPVDSAPDGWIPTGEVRTERIEVSPAWDERVLATEAWTGRR
jgi:hypothetical protein